MSELKYKVGDKVRIKSIDWYNENKDEDGYVICGEYDFVPYMSVFCGKILTIDVKFEDGACLMMEDTDGFVFTNEMIEGLVEEEYNSELKFKVGDRVRIKSLDWYNKNKDEDGDVSCGEFDFVEGMKKFCSEVFTISEDAGDGYLMLEDNRGYVWTDEMIEGLVEEEVFIKANDIYNEEYSKGEYCHEQSFKWGFQEGYNYSHENDKLEISLKEGYQFKDEHGNVINTTKIVLEKKKKEVTYPKTYEECLSVLGIYNGLPDVEIYNAKPSECELFESLIRLKRCRDAYWKIYGEEMGLGKPWEPDWSTENEIKYVIEIYRNNVRKNSQGYSNTTLAFPTAEMRDAFYENFKEEIEICKEFL